MNYQYLSTDEMMALERHAFENYPITLEQMMQNAGRAVFDVVMNEVAPKEILKQVQDDKVGAQDDKRVLVVTGKGNNGGDALVTARLLKEEGIEVSILSPYPIEEFSEMAKKELEKVMELGIPIVEDMNNGYSLIIDALFGFSLRGNPRPPADKIIEQILCSQIPVLSVDVPSGLDVHDGSIGNPIVKVDHTVVLGMLKKGFEEHADCVGKVYLGDLGIPEQAYLDMGYNPPLFRGVSYLPVN